MASAYNSASRRDENTSRQYRLCAQAPRPAPLPSEKVASAGLPVAHPGTAAARQARSRNARAQTDKWATVPENAFPWRQNAANRASFPAARATPAPPASLYTLAPLLPPSKTMG